MVKVDVLDFIQIMVWANNIGFEHIYHNNMLTAFGIAFYMSFISHQGSNTSLEQDLMKLTRTLKRLTCTMNATDQIRHMMSQIEHTARHVSKYCMKNDGESWICPRVQNPLVGLVRKRCTYIVVLNSMCTYSSVTHQMHCRFLLCDGIYYDWIEEHPLDGGAVPPKVVRVDPFFIDEAPVTNKEFGKFVRATYYETEAEKFGWSFVLSSFLPNAEQLESAEVDPEAVRAWAWIAYWWFHWL